MASWPATLPQRLLLDGFTEGADEVVIRSTVDVGPAKLRPRYTAQVAVFSGTLILTAAQVDTLEDFYQDTLAFGSDAFDWTHPRTLAAATFRFRERPQYSGVGSGLFRVSLALEVMP